jgi:hypothetical protein
MTLGKYKLDAHGEPIPEPDLLTWAAWLETADRHVALDIIGTTRISTVFLGLDHNFSDQGDPILWETMVFNGPCNQEQHRCGGSREQAEAMHARVLAEVQAEMGVNVETGNPS